MKLLSLEPESSASANSAMPASSVRLSLSPQRSIIIAQWDGDVNTFSKSFSLFFTFSALSLQDTIASIQLEKGRSGLADPSLQSGEG